MNKTNRISAFLLLLVLAFAGFSDRGLAPGDDEIGYQGRFIKLSR